MWYECMCLCPYTTDLSLVLSEMGGLERHLSQIYTALQECPAMTDAVMLFRVWARQRGLGQVGSLCVLDTVGSPYSLSPSPSPLSLPSLPLPPLSPSSLSSLSHPPLSLSLLSALTFPLPLSPPGLWWFHRLSFLHACGFSTVPEKNHCPYE